MKINPSLKLKDVGGEHLILLPASGSSELVSVLSINDTSKYLWENLAGKEFEIADAVALLLAEYEVEEAVAKSDASAWVNQLSQVGALL